MFPKRDLSWVPRDVNLLHMLTISTDTLPHTDATYVAFRIAFQETLERIVLVDQLGTTQQRDFGFLWEIPFLRQIPAQVQLDLLVQTWARHLSEREQPATMLDECVIYSACQATMKLLQKNRRMIRHFLKHGPRAVDDQIVSLDQLEEVQLSGTSGEEFLLLTHFLDVPPRDARVLRAEIGIRDEDLVPMFEAFSRWHVRPEFRANAAELLTPIEILRASALLKVPLPD